MQLRNFDGRKMTVIRTISIGDGKHVHETTDGWFWGPGWPLRETEVAEKFPAPYRVQALKFIEAQKERDARDEMVAKVVRGEVAMAPTPSEVVKESSVEAVRPETSPTSTEDNAAKRLEAIMGARGGEAK